MKKTQIIAIETAYDPDGWIITIEHPAWKDDKGNIYEYVWDRDGWPIEVLREDWEEKI